MLLDDNIVQLIEDYYVPLQVPIPYKEWNIYPILVKDSFVWMSSFDVFHLDQLKNTTGKIEYITATYLHFLRLLDLEDREQHEIPHKMIGEKIYQVLKLSLHLDDEQILWGEQDGQTCLTIEDKNGEQHIITAEDFDMLRKIIAYQNIAGFKDEYIDPEVQEVIDEVNRLKNKKQSNGVTTTMRKIAIVQNSLGFTHEQIMNMSFREFLMAFTVALDKVEYICLRTAELNPDVSFKKPIEHWACEYDHSEVDGAFMDYGSLDRKLSV